MFVVMAPICFKHGTTVRGKGVTGPNVRRNMVGLLIAQLHVTLFTAGSLAMQSGPQGCKLCVFPSCNIVHLYGYCE